jgi:hypothetical protein
MSCARCPSGVFAGILWPVWPDDRSAPEGWSWLQCCHACGRYPDDEAAALALQAIGFGTRFQWFDRHNHEPHDQRVTGSCSLAIDFPEQWRSAPRFGRPRDTAVRSTAKL